MHLASKVHKIDNSPTDNRYRVYARAPLRHDPRAKCIVDLSRACRVTERAQIVAVQTALPVFLAVSTACNSGQTDLTSFITFSFARGAIRAARAVSTHALRSSALYHGRYRISFHYTVIPPIILFLYYRYYTPRESCNLKILKLRTCTSAFASLAGRSWT